MTAEHSVGVDALPWLHRDPFDRLLVAQARADGMKLLSLDPEVNAYSLAGDAAAKARCRVVACRRLGGIRGDDNQCVGEKLRK